jgi:hypothetical protein
LIIVDKGSVALCCVSYDVHVRNATQLIMQWIQSEHISLPKFMDGRQIGKDSGDDMILIGDLRSTTVGFMLHVEEFLGDWKMLRWLSTPRLHVLGITSNPTVRLSVRTTR